MQPLSLTLKGFRGIRDGLGRDELTLDFERLADDAQLVAIVGGNGRGKSTLMECMTPYSTMPSRAAAAGPGGFSFYDHVYLPESVKDLTWAHGGRSYRSQIVIRLAGKRRTEAFLHVIDGKGRWQPVRLDDGTVSDGKVATYDRCVEAICGSADTFFTSVFAAQGKRPLSAYRNAEIKALLADLLGQAQIQAFGQKASETARLLRAGLGLVRQDSAGLEAEAQRLGVAHRRLAGALERLPLAAAARVAAQRGLEEAQGAHARQVADREQSAGIEVRRQQLLAERQAVNDADQQVRARLRAQERAERDRLDQLIRRIAKRAEAERNRRRDLEQSRHRCLLILAQSAFVRRASRRLPVAERVLSGREQGTCVGRERVKSLGLCDGALRLAEQRLAALEREAGKAALHAQDLARRFGLTGEVPCTGTELQGRCKLLGDAREAHALVPSAKVQIERLAGESALVQAELLRQREERAALSSAPRALARAERREVAARTRVAAYLRLAAQLPACDQAKAALEEIEREFKGLGRDDGHDVIVETAEEREERRRIDAAQRAIADQLDQEEQHARAALARVDGAIAALPPRCDDRKLAAAAETLAHSRATAAGAEQSHLAAQRDVQMLDALGVQLAALAERRSRCDARRVRIEDELGNWTLFARCMSNDGLIALAIDDAGPELSALANDLLLASYGPRFTVSIQTLLETAKGDQREGFDIVVHDAESAESKSLTWMSGGECTIIEACLTRAIALYLAQNSGRKYTTLFSDEADGALDPDRKRMFMAMKRQVLRLGGYEREFFVSQTPELAAMADAVIDLETYFVSAASDDHALGLDEMAEAAL
jgi:exonuclease SbcC